MSKQPAAPRSRVWGTEAKASAAYVVRAVECVPELLAAIKGMVGLHDDPTPYDSATTISAARAALTKAEERS